MWGLTVIFEKKNIKGGEASFSTKKEGEKYFHPGFPSKNGFLAKTYGISDFFRDLFQTSDFPIALLHLTPCSLAGVRMN